jgi:hypothetical protein
VRRGFLIIVFFIFLATCVIGFGAWTIAGGHKAAAETKAAKEAGIAIADTALIAVSSAIEAKVAVSGASALQMGQIRRTMNQSPLMGLQRMLSNAAVSGDTAQLRAAANELAKNPDYAGDIPKGGIKDKDLAAFVSSASGRVNIGASQIRSILDNTEKNINTMAGVFSVGEEAILGMAAVTETELMSATAGWGHLAMQLSGSLIQDSRELQYAADILTAQLTQGEMKGFTRGGIYAQLGGIDMAKLEGSGLLIDFYADGIYPVEIEDLLARLGINVNLAKMTPEELMEPSDIFSDGVVAFVDAVDKLILALPPTGLLLK